jgi:hypothetical protein
MSVTAIMMMVPGCVARFDLVAAERDRLAGIGERITRLYRGRNDFVVCGVMPFRYQCSQWNSDTSVTSWPWLTN